MARNRVGWRIWKRRERSAAQDPIGTSQDPYDTRYWTWGRDNRDAVPGAGGGLGDLSERDYGAFSDRRPPWLGPSRDARLMQARHHVPQQPAPVGEVPAVRVHRSDERIREDVCEALRGDDWIDATHIQVDVQEQNVVLSGEVRERNQKWLAEDIAERVLGVRAVINRIRVGLRELEGPLTSADRESAVVGPDNGQRTSR